MADKYNISEFNLAETQGFQSDLAPTVRGQPSHFVNLENYYFESSNSIRKFGGESSINATQISGTPNVTGMFDFHRAGTAGSFTQTFISMTSDGKLWSESAGVLTDITGAMVFTADAMPFMFQARDALIILTDVNDTVATHTTGNATALGGSPPAGRGGVFHQNRPWIYSANATPSRITYGSSTAINDYTGADTGTIDIDPEDGDRIIGAIPYKNNLAVFKGPNKGSIHIIGGRTPSTFTRDILIRGEPLQSPNDLISVGDDVWFRSADGIFSLAATERFGNFTQSDVTKNLKGFFKDSIVRTAANKGFGVNYKLRNCVLFNYTPLGATEMTQILGISYLNAEKFGFRPFKIVRSCISMAIKVNPTTKVNEVITGSTDGFLNRQDQSTRALRNGNGYGTTATLPFVILGQTNREGKPEGDQPVQLHRAYIRSKPTGAYNVTMELNRDDFTATNYTFDQGIGGSLWGTAIWGTSRFGGGSVQTRPSKIQGQARAVQIKLTTPSNTLDTELFAVGLEHLPIAKTMATNLYTDE